MSYEFRNTTNHKAMRFHQVISKEKRLYGVAILKRSQTWSEETFVDMAKSKKICLSDQYFSDPLSSSIIYPSELSPTKPFCDFIILGTAESDTFKSGWIMRAYIENCLDKSLRLHGPRYWNPLWKPKNIFQLAWDNEEKDIFQGWELTESEQVNSIPLIYENSFGGSYGANVHIFNPVGCGWLVADTNHRQKYRAPQIEPLNEPITDPFTLYHPAGFGPITSSWEQRRLLSGTYDEHWEKERKPLLPDDLDSKFWNFAPNDQQLPKDQVYGKKTHISGLCKEGNIEFDIPNDRFYLCCIYDTRRINQIIMHPDTMILDWNKRQFHIIYRCDFPLENMKRAEIISKHEGEQ